jgi:hypothetical protein
MAHRTSAAALFAARAILKKFTLTPRPADELAGGSIPNLQGTEVYLAVILDYATNIFELVKHRPELRHWTALMKADQATAPQIAGFLKRLVEAYDLIPKFSKTEQQLITTTLRSPKEFGSKPVSSRLSKPALEAARFVFYYYHVMPRYTTVADDKLDRLFVAVLVEGSMNLTRILSVEPVVRQSLADLKAGKLTPLEVKRILRALGVLLEWIPNYFGDYREEELKLL